jgi:mRNA interferase MazF
MENQSTMIKNNIVLVPFPFDDFSVFKVRPAICLTSEIGQFEHIVIAFISSNTKKKPEKSDIFLNKNSRLAKGTGLAVDSVIKLHRMVTIPKNLIKRKLGEANSDLKQTIQIQLKTLFEID